MVVEMANIEGECTEAKRKPKRRVWKDEKSLEKVTTMVRGCWAVARGEGAARRKSR
jgi:hypothetical protein